jgi:IMP cyclohydrolase
MGMPVRDAIALGLLAMDYEKDSLDTPRVVAVAGRVSKVGFLGIVRKDALLVREFALEPGVARYISTYEKNVPCDSNVDREFTAACQDCAAHYVVNGGVFADFEQPVTSAAAMDNGEGFSLATVVC